MSLSVNPMDVTWVLLEGDAHGEESGWWEVEGGLRLDAFEFVDELGEVIHSSGPGFAFRTPTGNWVYGPLSSILAVKVDAGSVEP